MKYMLLAAAMLVAPWAQAQEVPAGVTVLNLSATARQTVVPDTLHANLQIQHKAKTPEAVQQFINSRMKQAVDAVERMKGVKVVTGSYNVYERWLYNEDKEKEREKVWQGQQSVSLEGKDQAQVLKAAALLQKDGFNMQGLSYSLSQTVSDSFQEALMAEALGTIQQRAERFAKQLGKTKVHLANLSFDGSSPRPPMLYARAAKAEMMMASDAVMAEPVARADDIDLTASVNAEVWLSE